MGSTERVLMAIGAAVVLMASCLVAGIAASFQEAPPTVGVYRANAYTLRGREWQIGADVDVGLATLPQGISLRTYGFGVAYGVTNQFQAGIVYYTQLQAEQPFVIYALSTKLGLSLGVDLDLGVPFSVEFYDARQGIQFRALQSGFVVSMRLGGAFTLHGGTVVGLSRQGVGFVSPYASADFDLLPNLKLMGEVGLIPLSVAVGGWLRPLPFLDVKLALAPVLLSLTAAIHVRF